MRAVIQKAKKSLSRQVRQYATLRTLRVVLGVASLVAIPFWLLVSIPERAALPDDFVQTAEVSSYDNFFDAELGRYQGESPSITQFSYRVTHYEDELLDVVNTFDVRTFDGDPIFQAARHYAVDELTGRHVAAESDRGREGYLFAPRMRGLARVAPDKTNFVYWHVNYDTPLTMRFRSEEELYGLPVYRYDTAFTVDQTPELTGVLPEVGTTRGVVLDGTLSLWVEPFTGRVVKYQDAAEAFYYDLDTGQRLYPWNKFRNNITPNSVAQLSKEVSLKKQTLRLLTWVGCAVPLLVGILLLGLPLFSRLSRLAMARIARRKQKIILPLLLAGGVFLFFLVLSLTARTITRQQVEADFASDAYNIDQSIEDRLAVYANALRAGRGLFDASSSVNRDEWRAYVNSMDIQREYPGIQGVGFAPFLSTPAERDGFISEVQAEGFADFSITPTPAQAVVVPVLFLEPFDARNRRAFGYDMYSEAVRREAMNYARDTGQVGVTGKVLLVQETDTDQQAGFLMYEPWYGGAGTPATVEARRNQIAGYVYAPFRMRNFMVGIFAGEGSRIGIEIFDGADAETLTDDRLMYASDLAYPESRLVAIQKLEFYNRVWTIRYTAPPGYGFDVLRSSIATAVLAAGLVLSILVYLVAYIINTRKDRAVALAKQMTRRLSREKARSDAILASIGDGLVVTDTEKRVVFVNKAFERLLGYPEEVVKGQVFTNMVPLVEKGSKKVEIAKRPMTRALKTKKQTITTLSDELAYKTKAGALLPVSMVVSPIIDDGHVVGIVEVFRDISHEQAVDQAKTEFVSLASHQLKTPLTSINWYTELLLDKDAEGLGKDQQSYVQEIHEASQRMSELVNSLLNVSRLELGTFAINPTQSNIVTIAKGVVKEQRPSIKARKQKFKLTVSEQVPTKLSVDPQLMFIVIQNLVSNASKYTPTGGSITLAMDTVTRSRQKYVQITCTDTGIGIPEAQQDKVFEKLFRAENARTLDVDGTGLGLYIIKQIAEAGDCSISFTSKSGKGTTFEFLIPLTGMKAKKGTRTLAASGTRGTMKL